MKVLFISAWYPNRYDSMSGLCVHRHLKSISTFTDTKVLYIHPNITSNKFEITDSRVNGLNEIIIYYPAKNRNVFQKAIKIINYLRAYKKGYSYLKKNSFSPDIIHANILTRTGVIAYIYKLWKKVPYVISEHYSRYLPNRIEYRGSVRKFFTKKVVKNASAVLPVSIILKEALINHQLYNPNYKIINNVVDECFLKQYSILPHGKKRILHVSCFNEEAKNIRGILNAIKKISEHRQDFELIIVGTGKDYSETYTYAESLNLLDIVSFKGELPPEKVADWYQNSDFFVLFSNYETASVVIAESLCSGKPVVTSKVGGAPEWINKKNGMIVKPGDEINLENAMNYMLDHFSDYDSETIKSDAKEKFSADKIGKQLISLYEKILKENM